MKRWALMSRSNSKRMSKTVEPMVGPTSAPHQDTVVGRGDGGGVVIHPSAHVCAHSAATPNRELATGGS